MHSEQDLSYLRQTTIVTGRSLLYIYMCMCAYVCVSRHEFIFVMFVSPGPCRIFLAEPSARHNGF